ncbi:MAG TPA: hypothetical protein DD473_02970 [Planctomycetaceae bacterium]|nr:hypothetical protein [Planctomycetaceae bacterium]|tara:strand:+ start:1438 stop:1917 length:480 start_codon:yes stop_codon:yes gene_type:complete
MIIQKSYKFYAAHRNEELQDKCSNLHGHRYGIVCHFQVERDGAISTLFGDFDHFLEPHLKENYDHAMLIHQHDPLYETLQGHMERTGENLRLKVFPNPTSVENLAFMLFSEIREFGLDLVQLDVQETDTSIIQYTLNDWRADQERFEAGAPHHATVDSP